MIPRFLVPRDLRFPPPEAAAKPGRQSSSLDSRFVVPNDLPIAPIDPKSKIPAHVPLDVLSARTIVPRDLPAKLLGDVPRIPEFVPLTILDSRVVIPPGLEPGKLESHEPLPPGLFEGAVEPDVITTGEVTLLRSPVGSRVSDWNQIARFGSLVLHIALVVFILFTPKLFPAHTPTQEELELARRQLSFVYLPPEVKDVPKTAPSPEPPSAKMRIDPRILHQVAPPEVEPTPLPGPPREAPPESPNLPAAPTPQVQRQPAQQIPRDARNSQDGSQLRDIPEAPSPSSSLALPHMSPGKALEQSLRDAARGAGPTSGGFADPIPQGPGGGGGGGGQGLLGGNLEMLTPTEGVDFSNYLARLLASVRRNWYAVIPESARLGEKGRVILQFRIARDGTVPYPEPALVRTSGKEPLDRAAMAAIRASNPFEPLPPAFSGPYIELRFTFLYNLPLNYQ
jgi:TonB family protein